MDDVLRPSPEVWLGLVGTLDPVHRHSCYHLLLRTGNWIRIPHEAESPNVTASSAICLVFPNTLKSTHIHALVSDSCLCTLSCWILPCTGLKLNPDLFLSLHFPRFTWWTIPETRDPHWDMSPWWADRFSFGFQFIFILKSHQRAISIDSTAQTNSYWTTICTWVADVEIPAILWDILFH